MPRQTFLEALADLPEAVPPSARGFDLGRMSRHR